MLLGQIGDRVDRGRHVAAHQFVHVSGGPLVRHVQHFDAGLAADHHAKEMRQASRTGRRVRRLARIRLRPCDVLGPRLGPRLRTCGDRKLELRTHPDGREVLDRIVRERLVRMRNDGHRTDRHHHDRRSIGRSGFHRVGGDTPDGAGTIFDDHRLPKRIFHLVGDDARHHICSAARGKSDQDLDRTIDLVLRQQRGGDARQCNRHEGERKRNRALHRFVLEMRSFLKRRASIRRRGNPLCVRRSDRASLPLSGNDAL